MVKAEEEGGMLAMEVVGGGEEEEGRMLATEILGAEEEEG